MKCQAGCATEVVCKALGLGLRDLFPTNNKPPRTSNRRIVATYDYCDENGDLLFQAVRYDLEGLSTTPS